MLSVNLSARENWAISGSIERPIGKVNVMRVLLGNRGNNVPDFNSLDFQMLSNSMFG